jgi:hypothetical protein
MIGLELLAHDLTIHSNNIIFISTLDLTRFMDPDTLGSDLDSGSRDMRKEKKKLDSNLG